MFKQRLPLCAFRDFTNSRQKKLVMESDRRHPLAFCFDDRQKTVEAQLEAKKRLRRIFTTIMPLKKCLRHIISAIKALSL
jgi:hypothetical protein